MHIFKMNLFTFLVFAVFQLSAQEYGSMFIYDNSSAQTPAVDTWITVQNFTAGNSSSNWSFSSNQLTAPTTASTYLVRYSLSFTGTEGDWQIGISINGGTPQLVTVRRLGATSDVGNGGGCGILSIPTGATVELQVKTDYDPGSIIITPAFAQVCLVEVKQSTSPAYAEMSVYAPKPSPIVTSIPTGSVSVTLDGFSSSYANLNGWTYASNTLSASTGSGGIYLCVASVSFNGDSQVLYEMGVSVNDAEPDTAVALRHSSGNADEGNAIFCGILNIAENDDIKIKIKHHQAGTKNIDIYYATLTLMRISGTSAAPYASMGATGNTTSTAIPQADTWTQVSTLSGDARDGNFWQFDETNTRLYPVNLAAGYYLVNYFISVTYDPIALNVANFLDFSLFIKGTEQNELTIRRKLQSKDANGENRDEGAASGTGIIIIDYFTDSLSFSIRSDKTDPIVITNANFSLVRLETIADGSLPVELQSFDYQSLENAILLKWSTASELENLGFKILRSENPEGPFIMLASYKDTETLQGAGNSSTQNDYQYLDTAVESGNIYWYQLVDVDYSGNEEIFGPLKSEYKIDQPTQHVLYPNYPNPFNPETTIRFDVPAIDGKLRNIKLQVYNVLGQLVSSLFSGEMPGGHYEMKWNASNQPSGVYFIQFKSGNFIKTRKMMLIR